MTWIFINLISIFSTNMLINKKIFHISPGANRPLVGTAPVVSSTTKTTNLNSKPATGQTYSFTSPLPATPAAFSFTKHYNWCNDFKLDR